MSTLCYIIPGADNILSEIGADGLTTYRRETHEQVLARDPLAIVVSYDTWAAERAARQDEPGTWLPVTEERYNDMLGCLPPAAMDGGAFLVGEPYDHHARTGQPRFDAFRRRGEAFETYSRPMTRAEFRAMLEASSAHSAAIAEGDEK